MKLRDDEIHSLLHIMVQQAVITGTTTRKSISIPMEDLTTDTEEDYENLNLTVTIETSWSAQGEEDGTGTEDGESTSSDKTSH